MTKDEFAEIEENIRRERDVETQALIDYLKSKLLQPEDQ